MYLLPKKHFIAPSIYFLNHIKSIFLHWGHRLRMSLLGHTLWYRMSWPLLIRATNCDYKWMYIIIVRSSSSVLFIHGWSSYGSCICNTGSFQVTWWLSVLRSAFGLPPSWLVLIVIYSNLWKGKSEIWRTIS